MKIMEKTVNDEKCFNNKDEIDLIGSLEKNGAWQKVTFFFCLLINMPSAWHSLVMSFLAPNMQYWCARPSIYSNISKKEWNEILEKLISMPKNFHQCYTINQPENRSDIMERIYLLSENSSSYSIYPDLIEGTVNLTFPCQQWDYDYTEYTDTIVNQFDLVCNKEWMISWTKSIYMIGYLSSLLIMGHIGDRFGRKPVIISSFFIFIIFGITCAFSVSFVMFATCRFFIGFGLAGLFDTTFVHLMEIVSAESRSFYGIAIEFGWATGYVMLPVMAWMIRDWRWLQLIITIPCVPLFVLLWHIPESPRWLLTKGKPEKVLKMLSKITKTDGKDISSTEKMEIQIKKTWCNSETTEESQEKIFSILDLFRTQLWKRTLNMSFAWFVSSFIYYGLSYNTNDLVGNPFINFAVAGAVEFPAYIISMFVIKSMGRRKPLMVTLVVGGAVCLITLPLKGNLTWISMPLSMFGKLCITASFGIVYVYCAEVFPTVVRTTGLGWCSLCARVGSVVAPFVKELGQYTHYTVPFLCYGILSIISGFLILLLPETNGVQVPDTIEDCVKFGLKTKNEREKNEE